MTMRFLITVQLADTSPARIQSVVPALKIAIQKFSKDPIEQAFRSVTADLFAFCVITSINEVQIRAALEAPGGPHNSTETPILNGDDALLILQVGERFMAGKGFTRLGAWLQRHPEK